MKRPDEPIDSLKWWKQVRESIYLHLAEHNLTRQDVIRIRRRVEGPRAKFYEPIID